MELVNVQEVGKGILCLLKEVEGYKEAYKKLDILMQTLIDSGVRELTLDSGDTLEIVDNFKDKNTVFRPAAVRRFEVRIKE